MKTLSPVIRILLVTALFATIATSVFAAGSSTPLPLQNGSFTAPSIAPEKWRDGAKFDHWTYDIHSGSPGIHTEFWTVEKHQFFFWNQPDGSISQTIDASKCTIPHAGDFYTLAYTHGGQVNTGGGSFHFAAKILVGGVPKVAKEVDVVNPVGGKPVVEALIYTAKPEDVGKTIGVSFVWSNPSKAFIQGQLKDVSLTVTAAN